MQCQRCQGLMLGSLLDKHPTGCSWVWGWRCVNCGLLLDPRLRQRDDRVPEAVNEAQPTKIKIKRTRIRTHGSRAPLTSHRKKT